MNSCENDQLFTAVWKTSCSWYTPPAGCTWGIHYFVSNFQNIPNKQESNQFILVKVKIHWSWYAFSNPTLLLGIVTLWTILNLGHCCFVYNGIQLFRKAKQWKFGKINLLEACKTFCLLFHYLPDIYWFP